MKLFINHILFLIVFIASISANAQIDALAREYLKNNEYSKAATIYKKLHFQNRRNTYYSRQLVTCYQQLGDFNSAENILKEQLRASKYAPFFIDLGYNYQLKKDTINATINYNKAIDFLETRTQYASTIGRRFTDYNLLNEAIKTYNRAQEINPELQFNLPLAKIYGEQGNITKMFNSYLDYGLNTPAFRASSKRLISSFITEDKTNENNILLKRCLLIKLQKNPNIYWNSMLSWLFIQQKELKKAFTQEKGIYKRNNESLSGIIDLGEIAKSQKRPDLTIKIFDFVIENSADIEEQLSAHKSILESKLSASNPDKKSINKTYTELIKTYNNEPESLDLKISYAHFLGFHYNNPEQGIRVLKKALKQHKNSVDSAKIKMELANILVLKERFNEALIYYTQIQRTLKNSTLSQEARFKVAKTSYYKGDFKWAESQLRILKASTSQLTANDALDLKLLISDNKQKDSLQLALKDYAKADLLAYQNKKSEAITMLETIKKAYPKKKIIPQTLLKQALLLEEKGDFNKAEKNYKDLIKNHPESILLDDAIYKLALLQLNHLDKIEAAKKGFETIIFNHADSIYFIDARKNFRRLRGDIIAL